MAVTDFLFSGSPPPQVDTYSATTASVPDWWSTYTKGLIAKASSIAGEPYQAYTGPRVAGATPDQTASYDAIRAGQGAFQPGLTAATDLATSAGGANPLGTAQPYLAQAGALNAPAAAQPYVDAASGSFPDAAASYLSPFVNDAASRTAELTTRNLLEKTLPAVQDQFIGAGQAGSTRGAEFTSRAVRDAQNEISGNIGALVNQAYSTAGNLYQTDAARQAALAGTVGNLTGAQAGQYANIGALSGQLESAGASNQLAASDRLGALGLDTQSAGLRDAAALQAVGQEQQNEQQRNLDTAYQAFLEQRNYPRENIEFLNSAIRGVNPPTSSTKSGTQPATSVGASPLAQLAGAGLSAAAISNLIKARGGRVSVPRAPVRGALSGG